VIVLVAGTGTDVGKTWVTASVATTLRQMDVPVRARKPAQSFAPSDAHTDADVLGRATGEPAAVVCPPERWYPTAMAPPIAADALRRSPFTIAELVAELPPDGAGVLLVESAGGVRSPLAYDGDTVTLADALTPACVVLVADAGLGTINAVRLSIDALRPASFPPAHFGQGPSATSVRSASHPHVIVFLNRYDADDEVHARNREWLVTREGLEIETDPEALARTLAARVTG
jgi:dethiobiotin synthetase